MTNVTNATTRTIMETRSKDTEQEHPCAQKSELVSTPSMTLGKRSWHPKTKVTRREETNQEEKVEEKVVILRVDFYLRTMLSW